MAKAAKKPDMPSINIGIPDAKRG
ncbi:MAG TPA: DNA starvation/stationary phase protection protein, partial [Limnobacter sp.]|nr:DNA starvation/stationary phase protection protein [Limnobacter sp.]